MREIVINVKLISRLLNINGNPITIADTELFTMHWNIQNHGSEAQFHIAKAQY